MLQVNLGDLQIDSRLLAGFVKGIYEALGFLAVGSVQALAFLGEVVEGIENPVFPRVVTVSLFHGSFCIRASHSPVPTG